ncbi:MAG: hypothetical protein LBT10_06550 [Methanobrevibacter sp.]|nr:hypothetical protein [Methanobrevibacter sp.]
MESKIDDRFELQDQKIDKRFELQDQKIDYLNKKIISNEKSLENLKDNHLNI